MKFNSLASLKSPGAAELWIIDPLQWINILKCDVWQFETESYAYPTIDRVSHLSLALYFSLFQYKANTFV